MRRMEPEVGRKKSMLGAMLADPMQWVADNAMSVWPDPDRLDWILADAFNVMPYAHLLYALDLDGVQISANVGEGHADRHLRGQNLAQRPYLEDSLPYQGFILSRAYISQDKHEPCITAVQAVRRGTELLGFVAADFDLKALPAAPALRNEDSLWQQFRGDPAIRSTLFMQTRARSFMDDHLEEALAIMTELMCYHGIFHGKLHFSSSRFTVWQHDEPHHYRLHAGDDIIDPDLCLSYPKRSYPDRARLPACRIRHVLEQFRALRQADDTVYLRSGSLNVMNGMVGLNFSCDGSHYMRVDEFLDRQVSFWTGWEKQEALPCAV